MVFYFSGTGNSRWVAEQIAALRDEKVYNISLWLKDGEFPSEAMTDNTLIVVFPIHCWLMPKPVMRFLRSLQRYSKSHGCKLCLICTCGDNAGKALHKVINQIKIPVLGCWSVQMPNTYVPMFELDSHELCLQKIASAKERIVQIAAQIRDMCGQEYESQGISLCARTEEPVYQVTEGAKAWIKTNLVPPLFYGFCVSVRGFSTEDSCNGCATCMKSCPIGNISMKNGQPYWNNNCIHCMACYHACPKNAIQFKKATQHKGQYRLKNYL